MTWSNVTWPSGAKCPCVLSYKIYYTRLHFRVWYEYYFYCLRYRLPWRIALKKSKFFHHSARPKAPEDVRIIGIGR